MMKRGKLIVFDWNGIFEPNEKSPEYNFMNVYQDAICQLSRSVRSITVENIWDTMVRECSTLSRMTSQLSGYSQNMMHLLDVFDVLTDFEELCKFERTYLDLYKNVNIFNENLSYVRALSDRCYTALLSDVDVLNVQRLYRTVRLDTFDYVQLSCTVGYSKKQIQAYQILRGYFDMVPKDILFLDDRESNLAVARELGWNTVRLENPDFQELRKVCEEFLAKE